MQSGLRSRPQVNQIDPDNPIVNTIDEQQREINQARSVAEVSPEKPLTDEYARKRQNVANALRRYLNRLGLGNRVDLVTQNVILPEGVDKQAKTEGLEDQLGREGIIEGFEQAGENGRRIIAVAMEIYDPNLTEEQLAQKIGGVLNHEIIHALRGLVRCYRQGVEHPHTGRQEQEACSLCKLAAYKSASTHITTEPSASTGPWVPIKIIARSCRRDVP